eukprot:31543-Pelagococcus_subviridis.AAC.2
MNETAFHPRSRAVPSRAVNLTLFVTAGWASAAPAAFGFALGAIYESDLRCVLYTGSHTTPSAWCTPFLKDFSRRFSPPTPRFQAPPSAPFNST